jgi:hypothetical protein
MILPVAFWPMRWMLWHLRLASNIPREREDKDVGVPPLIGGTFERLLAFGFALFAVQDALTLLALLARSEIGCKLAAVPREPTGPCWDIHRAHSRVVSVAIGYFAGGLVRHAICQAGDFTAKALLHCIVSGP